MIKFLGSSNSLNAVRMRESRSSPSVDGGCQYRIWYIYSFDYVTLPVNGIAITLDFVSHPFHQLLDLSNANTVCRTTVEDNSRHNGHRRDNQALALRVVDTLCDFSHQICFVCVDIASVFLHQ